MTPQEFCQQSVAALQLAAREEDAQECALFETLLGYFATLSLSPSAFERQLLLLAEPGVCRCMSRAAVRVLALWCAEQARTRVLAALERRN
jgi:hypothetical protein